MRVYVNAFFDGSSRVTSLAAPIRQNIGKPRRGVHRITIETEGLSDEDAAKLHHSLITVVKATGHLHNYRTTSLVGKMRRAKEDLDYEYRSADSPRAIKS